MTKESRKTNSMLERMNRKFSHIPSESARRMFQVELSRIRPNPEQPRKTFNEESLDELAQSIQKHGQLQPVVLKRTHEEDTYILAAGERRFRAHQRLGMTHIYAVLTDGSLDEIGLIENVQREDLHPLELAEYLDRMMRNHSWSQGELSNVIGKARKTVNEALMLNNLPEAIKEEWRTCATSIPKSTLLQIARLQDLQEKMAYWQQVKNGGLTVRAVREQRKTGATSPKASHPALAQTLSSGKNFTKKLKTLPVEELTEDALYELFRLQKEVSDLIEELDTRRRGLPGRNMLA